MSRKARAAAARQAVKSATPQQNPAQKQPPPNPVGAPRLYTDDQLIEAIKDASGNVTKAARRLGIDRTVFYAHLSTRQIEDARAAGYETVVDTAEMALETLVAAAVPSAVFFTLKTQGARRGWIEHRHVDHSGAVRTITDLLADEDDGADDAGDPD